MPPNITGQTTYTLARIQCTAALATEHACGPCDKLKTESLDDAVKKHFLHNLGLCSGSCC